MGLCKCPKKNMTSLFCFEHRVNVCEHCLVENHADCVVQTYLQWLSDSDFDPNCSLCATPLGQHGQSARLQCLHIYHWACLDDWGRRHPANTAPAGYRCPQCAEAVFPKPNQTSPMIEKLRETLSGANWARAGLGMQLKAEFDRPVAPRPLPAGAPAGVQANGAVGDQGYGNGGPAAAAAAAAGNYRASTPATVLNVDDTVPAVEFSAGRGEATLTTVRKKGYGDEGSRGGGYGGGADTRPLLGNDADDEANKYKRRPPMEWARGLWRAKYGHGEENAHTLTGWRRSTVLCLFGMLALCTVFLVLSRIVARPDEADPLLDPMANPNIRVAAEESRVFH